MVSISVFQTEDAGSNPVYPTRISQWDIYKIQLVILTSKQILSRNENKCHDPYPIRRQLVRFTSMFARQETEVRLLSPAPLCRCGLTEEHLF